MRPSWFLRRLRQIADALDYCHSKASCIATFSLETFCYAATVARCLRTSGLQGESM